MASTYLSRTFGTPTNASKFTYSAWVKRSALSSSYILLYANGGNSQNFSNIMFNSSDNFFWHILHSNSEISKLRTNAKLRDTNAWYHLVFQYDSTQATAANRTKMYINGVEVTSYATQTNSGQNSNYHMNTAVEHYIGAEKGNTGGSVGNYFDGSMSHVHFVDGTIYAPSTFGETDSTTGEWKIKTSPGISTANYGNNGFWILKDGNSVTDQSGNGNNWTVGGGTLTKTEDCPSNVFATLNPLIPMRGTPTYQSGNTYFRSDYSSWDSALSTIGATSGKWYFEAKWGNQDNLMIGCVDVDKDPEFLSGGHTYGYVGYRGISYFGETGNPRVIGNNNNDLVTGLPTFASGDIIGCAIDLDNREMFVHRNGTYTNSGNPATRANPYNMSTSINQGGTVLMGVASRSGYGIEVNFGNGYFSSTAVSSAGTNASGIGIFEYDVPTGYTALSTKGLNT